MELLNQKILTDVMLSKFDTEKLYQEFRHQKDAPLVSLKQFKSELKAAMLHVLENPHSTIEIYGFATTFDGERLTLTRKADTIKVQGKEIELPEISQSEITD